MKKKAARQRKKEKKNLESAMVKKEGQNESTPSKEPVNENYDSIEKGMKGMNVPMTT